MLLGGAGGLAWKRYFSRWVSETGGVAAVLRCFARRWVNISTRSAQRAAGECCRYRTQSQPVVEALVGRAEAEQRQRRVGRRLAGRAAGRGQCDAGDAGRTVAQEEGAVLMPEGWSSAGQARFPQTPPQGDHSGWLVRRASSRRMTRTAQETRARRKSCPGPLPTLLPFSALATCECTLSITNRVRRAASGSETMLLDFTGSRSARSLISSWRPCEP